MTKGNGDDSRESAFRASRREWLTRAGLLVSSTALPFGMRESVAQSESALNALPRIGLVIGNTKYVEAPLRNPANDARAIGTELQRLGFQVNAQLDAGRKEMIEAIRAFGNDLAKRKSVGLFYYAGHAAQLAWHNYLVPVDAVIERLEDMQSKTVELTILLDALVKAKNPMNVVILDACRDNPFGTKLPVQQKGLSQFDAPPGSLLAYATSPGNVASDGSGENGLYTENLVRELKTPDAKIEDVFKRVRLNVRRKSEGQQIPWESTSLEEDFYFQPPKQIRKLSEQELERQFNAELAVWEKIKDSKEPGPIEDYLRKNPSGRYAELAQFHLDRVLARLGEKKIEVINAAQNPFTKGTGHIDTHFKIGDSYSYREIDSFTKIETRKFTNRITDITDNEVIFNNGVLITDLFGNLIKNARGRYTEAQFFIPEYTVGKKWTTRFKFMPEKGGVSETEYEFRVKARESITVPAGTFDVYKVEGNGWGTGTGERGGSLRLQSIYWISPGVRRPVANENVRIFVFGARSKMLVNERQELIEYAQR